MNPEDLIKDLKNALVVLIKDKYGEESKAIKNDVETFLKESKEKLIRWTELLEQKLISKEEFELLMLSQKDLFVMKTLHKKGVSNISLGHFKNKAIQVVISGVFRFLFGKI